VARKVGILERLTTALADRYTIERELGAAAFCLSAISPRARP
jgi:hypothetical protein